MRRFIPLLTIAILAGSACQGRGPTAASSDPFSEHPTPSDSDAMAAATTGSPTASPTPPALPQTAPATSGGPSKMCEHGWVTPTAGTPLFTDPLGVIRRTDPVTGEFVVVDMRYFHGPESTPSSQNYLHDVTRWYIKLYDKDDLSYQGRFIVEQRTFGRGLAAVAPYDTHGFRSPDWSGFQFTSQDTARRPYAGLPGAWAGLRYNFVEGGEGLALKGLPDAVRGCLDGT